MININGIRLKRITRAKYIFHKNDTFTPLKWQKYKEHQGRNKLSYQYVAR